MLRLIFLIMAKMDFPFLKKPKKLDIQIAIFDDVLAQIPVVSC